MQKSDSDITVLKIKKFKKNNAHTSTLFNMYFQWNFQYSLHLYCWCFHAWLTEEQLQISIKLLFNILINLYTYLHPLQSVLAVKLPI